MLDLNAESIQAPVPGSNYDKQGLVHYFEINGGHKSMRLLGLGISCLKQANGFVPCTGKSQLSVLSACDIFYNLNKYRHGLNFSLYHLKRFVVSFFLDYTG